MKHPIRHISDIRLLQGLMAASLLLPLALFVYASWVNYHGMLESEGERIDRLLAILNEHAIKIFTSTELAIRAADEVTNDGNDETLRNEEASFHTRLGDVIRGLSQIRSVWVFDHDGRPLVSSSMYPVRQGTDYAMDDYFAAQADHDAGTFIGQLVKPRSGAAPVFTISRRRPTPDGRFDGVIAAAVDSADLESFYADFAQVPGTQITLVRNDGVILARYPGAASTYVRLGSGSSFGRLIARSPEGGTYTTASAVDGIERHYGVRKVQGYPIYVTTGAAVAALRAQWLATMGTHLIFGVPATLAMFATLWVVLRRTRRLHREIAGRQAAEEALRQSQKLEAVGHLTGGVAHDFNNLLTVVLGNLESALRQIAKGTEPSRLKRTIENAIQGARRGADLTRQLLAFSRRQPLEPRVLDVNELIRGMSVLLRRALGERLDIEIVGAAGLWRVEADPAQLEATFLNLAVNARDAMPEGGKLSIETGNAFLDEAYCTRNRDVKPGQYVLASITDNGIGMSQEVIERAFEPFFTTKEPGQGTGLGLSQVYGFVKQSGGHVKIYSEPGQGTTIRIYLPRVYGGHEPETVKDEPQPVQQGNAESILVVEDDEDVRSYVIETLSELGYRTAGARGYEEAIRMLEQRRAGFDLLLTDVVLPGRNGREVATEIRRLFPATRVLFMTGYSRNAIVHQGRLDPGVDMIPKPFSQAELARKIAAVLGQGST